jgi:hypothetical protein
MAKQKLMPKINRDLYPRCEGGILSLTGKLDDAARRKKRVLDAYYRINLCQRELQFARKLAGPASAPERRALQALEEALRIRDALDDQNAPYGLVSSPQVKKGIVTNVTFNGRATHGNQITAISLCFDVSRPRE